MKWVDFINDYFEKYSVGSAADVIKYIYKECFKEFCFRYRQDLDKYGFYEKYSKSEIDYRALQFMNYSGNQTVRNFLNRQTKKGIFIKNLKKNSYNQWSYSLVKKI